MYPKYDAVSNGEAPVLERAKLQPQSKQVQTPVKLLYSLLD